MRRTFFCRRTRLRGIFTAFVFAPAVLKKTSDAEIRPFYLWFAGTKLYFFQKAKNPLTSPLVCGIIIYVESLQTTKTTKRKNAVIAQLVEHFLGKEEVTSSNLVNSSKSLHVAPAVCRDCVLFGFGENRDSSPKRRGAVCTVLYSGYNRYNRNRPEVQQLRRRFPGFCLRTADTAAGR